MFFRKTYCFFFIFMWMAAAAHAQQKGAILGEYYLPAISSPSFADSLPDLATLPDELVPEYALYLTDHIEFLENILNQNALRMEYFRKTKEEELMALQESPDTYEDEMDPLKETIAQSKDLGKKAEKERRRATALVKSLVKMTESDNIAKLRKSLPDLRALIADVARQSGAITNEIVTFERQVRLQDEQPQLETKPPVEVLSQKAPVAEPVPAAPSNDDPEGSSSPPPAEPVAAAPETPAVREPESAASKTLARYQPKNDVMRFPPTTPCTFVANGKDEFSGQLYKEVKQEEILRFTHDFMKNQLPEGAAQILGMVALAQSGDVLTLVLTFNIAEKTARKSFGGLAKGSTIQLKMIDGSTLTLQNYRADEGVEEVGGTAWTFKGNYPIDRATLKKLRNVELDKIRVYWNKGFEDYDIYNVDAVKRMVGCF